LGSKKIFLSLSSLMIPSVSHLVSSRTQCLAELLKKISKMKLDGFFLERFFYNSADLRIRDRFLMGSPLTFLALTLVYLTVVKFLRLWMQQRKTFDVSSCLFALYSFYAAANGYVLFKIAPYWLTKYNWHCEPLDTSHSHDALQVRT
jgi:GNS1/SUR4 family